MKHLGYFLCMQEALDELATWLDAHQREVVIICCSHFISLTRGDHSRLVEYIISLFGEKLCSSKVTRPEDRMTCVILLFNRSLFLKICNCVCVYMQESPTLRSCWSRGQQVVVSYDDQQVVLHHPELWPEIPYWYMHRKLTFE